MVGRLPRGPGSDTFSLPSRGPSGSQQEGMPPDKNTSEGQQMSELDTFGLSGLMAQLRGSSQDQLGLMLGMDLNSLGLDLHRPE